MQGLKIVKRSNQGKSSCADKGKWKNYEKVKIYNLSIASNLKNNKNTNNKNLLIKKIVFKCKCD